MFILVCDVETLHLFSDPMIPHALLLGDSQTQLGWADAGWVSQLSAQYVRRLDLVNRGLSGYNTRMLLTVLPDILKHEDLKRVKVVTLMMGSNDASFPDTAPWQAVSLEEFGENMLKIISMLLNHGVKKESIILIAPPPILPDKWTKFRNSCPGPEYKNCKDNTLTKKYALEAGKVASRLSISFLDLFSAMMKSCNLDAALYDGLHLARDGAAVLCSLLVPELDKRLGAGDSLVFPEWREMENESDARCVEAYNKWKLENPDRL